MRRYIGRSQSGSMRCLRRNIPTAAFPRFGPDQFPTEKPIKANYPTTIGELRVAVKNYWDMYTLNDNTTGYLAQTLLEAMRVYQEPRYRESLVKLGDFLILAQMPDPQPGGHNSTTMPCSHLGAEIRTTGVSGDESQEVIETLLMIARETGESKYLTPIPSALQWLKKSLLPGNQLARYYELKTNRPLYMERDGEKYSLTYDDRRLPSHYGWKTPARLDELEKAISPAQSGRDQVPLDPAD